MAQRAHGSRGGGLPAEGGEEEGGDACVGGRRRSDALAGKRGWVAAGGRRARWKPEEEQADEDGAGRGGWRGRAAGAPAPPPVRRRRVGLLTVAASIRYRGRREEMEPGGVGDGAEPCGHRGFQGRQRASSARRAQRREKRWPARVQIIGLTLFSLTSGSH
ncbi:unnamed protein product [Urochloa humidicola]